MTATIGAVRSGIAEAITAAVDLHLFCSLIVTTYPRGNCRGQFVSYLRVGRLTSRLSFRNESDITANYMDRDEDGLRLVSTLREPRLWKEGTFGGTMGN